MIDEIRAIVHDTYTAELGGLRPPDDMDLFAGGLIDSFALINLVNALEARYGIRIPDSDATPANLGSVERAAGYIGKRLA